MENLEDTEAYWVYSSESLQVRKKNEVWIIDWPESESYEMGPMSIAWIMWHIIYWWSTALDYNFGSGSMKKDDVLWPGSIENAKEVIESLHEKWVSKLSELSDADFQMNQHAKWPLEDRNLADTALWLNAEFMKNAAEIGYARFLYGNSMKQK
ncbi:MULTISPECIES: DinB family protein [Bacilli]|uniref:DinB family protein n=1 Tax=Bacilli TaxID=91061 RepID=UPI000F493BAA|nr:DinB family protein [Enterococcus faecium]TQS75156.1 DinB family protein [Ornithinibacillus gellani]